MKKIKNANKQLFNQIISVNKQQENDFNNGQDGAIILSLLTMFFVPFLLLNSARNFFGIDYGFGSVIAMLFLSTLITVFLYKKFKIGSQFAEKRLMLEQLLSGYKPKNKSEYQKLQEDRLADPLSFFVLVNNWTNVEKQYYAS